MNTNVTSHEYHVFLDQMFYMYTKIAQYLRLTFESNVEIMNETIQSENLVQLVALVAYFPERNADRTDNFWQTKINLAHLMIHILLQQSASLYQSTNQAIVQHASALFSKDASSSSSERTSYNTPIVLFRRSDSTVGNDDQRFHQRCHRRHAAAALVLYCAMYPGSGEETLANVLRSFVRGSWRTHLRSIARYLRESIEHGIE